jgi:hypothetical protein
MGVLHRRVRRRSTRRVTSAAVAAVPLVACKSQAIPALDCSVGPAKGRRRIASLLVATGVSGYSSATQRLRRPQPRI